MLIPWFAQEPVGRDGLRQFVETGEKSRCCAAPVIVIEPMKRGDTRPALMR